MEKQDDLDLRTVNGRPISFDAVRERVRGYGVESKPVQEFAWLAAYEQALTATEAALSEVTHQRDVFRSCLRRAAESVSAHPLSGAESADSLAEFVVQEVSGLRDETLRAVQDVILLRDKAINERDVERTRADRAEAALATARSEALRAVEEERDETEREWVLRQAAEFCERELRQENDRLRAALAAYEEG